MVKKSKPVEVETVYVTGDYLAIHDESEEKNFTIVFVSNE
jgi:hypothetical protein